MRKKEECINNLLPSCRTDLLVYIICSLGPALAEVEVNVFLDLDLVFF